MSGAEIKPSSRYRGNRNPFIDNPDLGYEDAPCEGIELNCRGERDGELDRRYVNYIGGNSLQIPDEIILGC